MGNYYPTNAARVAPETFTKPAPSVFKPPKAANDNFKVPLAANDNFRLKGMPWGLAEGVAKRGFSTAIKRQWAWLVADAVINNARAINNRHRPQSMAGWNAAECLDGTWEFLALGSTYCGPLGWPDVTFVPGVNEVADIFGFWNAQIHGYRVVEDTGLPALGTVFTRWGIAPNETPIQIVNASMRPSYQILARVPAWKNVPSWLPNWNPDALPVAAPAPAVRPVPWHVVPQLPSSKPQGAPGKLPARGNNVDPKPVPRPDVLPKRPWKPVKETKAAVKWLGAFLNPVNWITESADAIEAVHKALPRELRAKPVWVPAECGKRVYTARGWRRTDQYADVGCGYFRASNPWEKAVAVYANWEKVDLGKALTNLVENQLEDYIIGKIGSVVGKASRKAGRPIGYQAGDAF